MRRILSQTLVVTMSLGLCGCVNNKTEDTKVTTQSDGCIEFFDFFDCHKILEHLGKNSFHQYVGCRTLTIINYPILITYKKPLYITLHKLIEL